MILYDDSDEDKKIILKFRNSIFDFLLNIDFYSVDDQNFIIHTFVLIEQNILNSQQYSDDFFTIFILEKICSFSSIFKQFEKIYQEIYFNSLTKFLQICIEHKKKYDVFNKLADYIILSQDPLFCDDMLNILSYYEFVKHISEKKIIEIASYLKLVYNRIKSNQINQNIYKNIIKIIIHYLVYCTPVNEKKLNNELIIELKDANFKFKLEVFSDIFLNKSQLNKYKSFNIPNNIISIIQSILSVIFYNFEDKNNLDIIMNFIIEITKDYKENKKNNKLKNNNEYVSLYYIIFIENEELTTEIFFYLYINSNDNNNHNKFKIEEFIETNILQNLILENKKSFIYNFILKCLNEKKYEFPINLLKKIIDIIGQYCLNENISSNYKHILNLIENYLNLLEEKIDSEYPLISIISKLFNKIKEQKIHCQIIQENNSGLNKPIFELIYDIFYSLFDKSLFNNNELEKLFKTLFLDNDQTLFSQIDNDLLSSNKNNNGNNIRLSKINYSLYFFTRYCTQKIPKNYENLFDTFFKKLFYELKKYLSKNKIQNNNEIKYYNEIKNLIIKENDFIKIKNSYPHNLSSGDLIQYNKINKVENNMENNSIKSLNNTSLEIFTKQMDFEIISKNNLLDKQIGFLGNGLDNKTKFNLNIFGNDINFDNCSFEILTNDIIINIKRKILLSYYSLYFKDIYFFDQNFINLKNYFKSHYDCNKETKSLKYPSKIKNFSNKSKPPLFLTYDINFFTEEYFQISHNYFVRFLDKLKFNTIPLFKKPIKIINDQNVFDCELIKVKYVIGGRIHLTNNFILFENFKIPYNEYIFTSEKTDRIEKNKKIFFYYSTIKNYIYKNYLFQFQAIEFYLKDGKSYLFNLITNNNFEKIKSILETKIKNKSKKITKYQNLWKEYSISTYEYLCKINDLSSRSYNNSSQYPIFPWVINNIDTIFENNPNNNLEKLLKGVENKQNEENSGFRIFKYPISIQDEEKRTNVQIRYSLNDEEFKFHHYCHYSTSSYIYYYLMRMNPFTNCLIKLQGNEHENVNRMFLSIEKTQLSLGFSNDNRELIPEIFSKIEQFINLNCSYFGKIQNFLIDDLIPIDYINRVKNANINNILEQFVELILLNNKILNSNLINCSENSISNWIDNVFGKYQFIEDKNEREKRLNTFPPTSYKQICCLDKLYNNYLEAKNKNDNENKNKLFNEIKEIINLLINFGIMPDIIFKNIHPIRINRVINNLEYNIPNVDKYLTNDKFLFYCHDKIFLLNRNQYFYIINKINDKKEKKLISPFQYNDNQIYQNLRYVINFSIENLAIICKYKDNSFRIKNLQNDKEIKILCEDYVNSIMVSGKKKLILIGLKNGKLEKYSYENEKLKYIDSILAHFNPIEIIEINTRLNIIITSDSDNIILIRKLYDFELLTEIKIPNDYEIKLIKISSINLIYVLCNYLNRKKVTKSIIFGYTLNGIKFTERIFEVINNICFTENNDLILGFYNLSYLRFCKGSNLSKIIDEPISFIGKELNRIYWFEKTKNNKIKILFNLENKTNYLIDIENNEI